MDDVVETPDCVADIRYTGGHQRRTCRAHPRLPRVNGTTITHIPGLLDSVPYKFVQTLGRAREGRPPLSYVYFCVNGQPFVFDTETPIPEGVEVWTL